MKHTLLFIPIIIIYIAAAVSFHNCSIDKSDTGAKQDSVQINKIYEKFEYEIAMRDGIKLFTQVYTPKDKSTKYPIMLHRTPYNVDPYGNDLYRNDLGPSPKFMKERFIFVYQDVRGRFMSEGEFINVRPMITNKSMDNIDESTDTYDTIEWLVKNIPNNNGRVGMWGISYPGFYAAAGLVNSHPALKAVSPQAPIADWFWDDFFHHGALFLPHAFNFFAVFGLPREEKTTTWAHKFDHGTPDGYKFFLEDVGPLKNVNEKFFKNNISFWNDISAHPNYDFFWQERNIRPHLKNIKPAVLVVGGLFDAEDLFGAFNVYKSIEENNPGINNSLVMGPWHHGAWGRDDGSRLGNIFFTDNPYPSYFYRDSVEFPFFNYYLKGKGNFNLPEAYIFETGTNKWRKFDKWPPKNIELVRFYMQAGNLLSFIKTGISSFDEFISDPNKPVPYTEDITTGMTKKYMTDDQRFAGRRTDVLVYRTELLDQDITFAGEIKVDLDVSITGNDADWIVKLIDVYPDDYPDDPQNPEYIKMGGYEQMVRSEIFRGRFRNSYEKSEPFKSNTITKVKFPLQGVMHTFKKGHRIMIQVQSTWFPLADRNPQKYVPNIFKANEKDFIKAAHRVYHSSFIEAGILK